MKEGAPPVTPPSTVDGSEASEGWVSEHRAGCMYGGFSCGYWLRVEECELEHWERHIVGADETCPCGTRFEECPPGLAIYDVSAADEAEATL